MIWAMWEQLERERTSATNLFAEGENSLVSLFDALHERDRTHFLRLETLAADMVYEGKR